MTAPTTAVAGVAGRDEILRSIIVPVMVKVINAQHVGVLREGRLPADLFRAPVARVGTGADGVVERNPVNVGTPVSEGQRMARILAHPVPLGIERFRSLICRAGAHHAPVVQVAEPIRLVRLQAPFDGAADCIPEVVNVPVVIKAPSVHLAEHSSPLIRLCAAIDRALFRPGRALEVAEGIAILKKTTTVFDAIPVRVVRLIAAFNTAFSHCSSISQSAHRSPSFYGATYCCRCRLHRPVGPEGEFTWVDDQGTDTHVLVGT